MTIFVVSTNYSSIERIYVQHRYERNNGFDIMFSLSSTFEAWGDHVDTSVGFKSTQNSITSFGEIYSDEALNKMKESSKNNVILDRDLTRKADKKTLIIDQCIFIKDIKVLYITYNTFLSNTNKIIQLSIYDDLGNLIISEPSWFNNTKGLMIHNSENFFWGIDFEKYEKLIIHIKVFSSDNEFLYEYDQALY